MSWHDVDDRIRSLYGVDLRAADGVLHVTSTGRTEDGRLATIRIGPDAPSSATDRFVLDVTRARADAIVTTGAVLRAEPGLCHALPAPMAGWRRDVLGKSDAPWTVVLSRGYGIEPSHPVFSSGRAIMITLETTAPALEARLPAGVRVIGRKEPSLRDAIEVLGELGCTTISIEAGPSTAQTLHSNPIAVDELLLSIWEHELPEALRVAPFLEEAWLAEVLGPPRSSISQDEASGRWSFRRYRRTSRLEPRRTTR